MSEILYTTGHLLQVANYNACSKNEEISIHMRKLVETLYEFKKNGLYVNMMEYLVKDKKKYEIWLSVKEIEENIESPDADTTDEMYCIMSSQEAPHGLFSLNEEKLRGLIVAELENEDSRLTFIEFISDDPTHVCSFNPNFEKIVKFLNLELWFEISAVDDILDKEKYHRSLKEYRRIINAGKNE
jgi:hypothetical protein